MGGQHTGHLIINGEKLLVLVRISSWNRYFKLRQSGSDGVFYDGESSYIEQAIDEGDTWYLDQLKAGETIEVC